MAIEAAAISYAIGKLGDFILVTLSDYATNNPSLLNDLRSNAEWLQSELGYMQSFLNDVDGKQEADYRVRHWISDVRKIAEDTTFALDEFAVKIDHGSVQTTGCVRSFVFTCCNRSDISDLNDQIKGLKARVEKISKTRERYGIRNLSGDRGQSSALVVKELRRTTSYADVEKLFVGFGDVKRQLLDELFKSEPHLSVVSIYGTGGLGKTTLARNLYNSTRVSSHFKSCAWICVSQEYDILDLLRSVIKSFWKGCNHDQLKMLEDMKVQDLERYIRDLLRDKIYLVVVDDVWGREAWESLKRAFPDCENGSRVVVTTRSKDVATRMDERVYAHHLRFLDPEESWELFSGKMFHGQEHESWCSPTMQDVGRVMVAKCKGLPLAVVVLGGLLLHKQNLEEWQQVKDHIWRHLANDSVEISHLLSLSYDNLPVMLRQCFLYLGTFPEDHLIDAAHLTYLWMGEQFIPSGEEMEDVAESCLNQLINRSLIQVANRYWDKINECRIHDLLRDLAIQKASKEDLFHIYNPNTSHSSLVHHRRHVVDSQLQRYFSTDLSMKRVQSLVVYSKREQGIDQTLAWSMISKLNNLCLLKLDEGCFWSYCELPMIFKTLLQLKYLGLSTTKLPPSIGKLKRLQTLEVKSAGDHCTLPPETSELKSLRHLICNMQSEADIGCLSNLRTLRRIQYMQWVQIKKEKLVNLRELEIIGLQFERSPIFEPFPIFNKLHTLVLRASTSVYWPLQLDSLITGPNLSKLRLEGAIETLPPIEKWPTSLTRLCLNSAVLKEDSILILGKLPNLRELHLKHSHESSTLMVFGPNSFPQLQILTLFGLSNLEKLELGKGAMPMIKCLRVGECHKLVDIPDKFKSVLFKSALSDM